jgi:Arc/MetJ-type ribon-helix-helix transcriptional regulator
MAIGDRTSHAYGAHYQEFIKRMIAMGRYTKANEVNCDALRQQKKLS